ncbi:hypothetical protein JCM10908_003682 [Rhodotorula pacifica]|uniref:uncharacterized protein n=1 Tax=Rhodotorula pacifica TaxID=1495444 RepID=UPI0031725F9F
MSPGRTPAVPIAASTSPSLHTPALTASTGSLSSSHGTVSSMPSSFSHFPTPASVSPVCGPYGSPNPSQFAAAAYDPHAIPISSAGAGTVPQSPFLARSAPYAVPLTAAADGEFQHFAMDEDVKGKGRAPDSNDFADAAQADRPPKRPTAPPADVLRRGEDLGLSLGDFDMLDTLGTGTFGRVILVRLRMSPSRPQQTQPHYFALKVLEKNTVVRLRQIEHVNSERNTLAHVQHPFVVNLFCTFQDEANLYMLLEFVQGGELFSHLRRAGRFSADVARFYVANLVLVLDHLHQQDIIYRDLKPENLLIGADGHIKVTDFGFAKYVQDRTFTLCGTPEYLAPEIITATGHGAAADWWALGVLLFELLAGYPPFFADNPLEIYEKILKGKFAVPAHIDPVAKDLIRRLLTADLTQRLGNLRNGAQDVKNHPWFEGVDWAAVERKEIRAPIIPLTNTPGDASNFERFPACSLESMPGVMRSLSQRKFGFQPELGSDPYGYLFPYF